MIGNGIQFDRNLRQNVLSVHYSIDIDLAQGKKKGKKI